MAAEHDRDNFYIYKGLLRHKSEDDWGDPRDQIVVPSKYRQELIALAHGSDTLEARERLRRSSGSSTGKGCPEKLQSTVELVNSAKKQLEAV